MSIVMYPPGIWCVDESNCKFIDDYITTQHGNFKLLCETTKERS